MTAGGRACCAHRFAESMPARGDPEDTRQREPRTQPKERKEGIAEKNAKGRKKGERRTVPTVLLRPTESRPRRPCWGSLSLWGFQRGTGTRSPEPAHIHSPFPSVAPMRKPPGPKGRNRRRLKEAQMDCLFVADSGVERTMADDEKCLRGVAFTLYRCSPPKDIVLIHPLCGDMMVHIRRPRYRERLRSAV